MCIPFIDPERIWRDIDAFSNIVDRNEQGHTRLSFSEQDKRARAHLQQLMVREADLSVHVDAAGNLIGRREGRVTGPAIMLGSHLDTVRGGGRFDGIAGVVAALEIMRAFHENGQPTTHPLEVVAFQAEEPSAFGISTFGSRAMAGQFKPSDLRRTDPGGRTLAQALAYVGGNPDRIDTAHRTPGTIHTYLELHIEQGPRLVTAGIPIGIVTSIVGIAHGTIEISGRADHSGTTPMNRRRDALTAAAEAILALETVCQGQQDAVVGTIGRLAVFPNALNVVPGRIDAGVEVRAPAAGTVDEVLAIFQQNLERIQGSRNVDIRFDWGLSSRPVHFHDDVIAQLASVCRRRGIDYLTMPSGAGHDAGHLAGIAPSGMVFIPCKDGRSHCSQEWSEPGQVALGAEILAAAILQRDGK